MPTSPHPFPPPPDFSIVLGGPLYQLLRRTRLSDDALALVHRRVLAGILITWVPLLVLSLLEGRAWWGDVTVPFLLNAEVQARFLIAMPLLILAELGVHLRMRQLVAHFFHRDLIADADQPRMTAAIESAFRWRNSLAAELLLIVVIYAVGIPMREYLAVDASTWASGSPAGTGFARLSPAGWWHALVSVPMFQFLLLRWYFRVVHLGPLSLAGVAHRSPAHSHASRPRRRPGISRQRRLCVHADPARARGAARGPDRRSHLL